MAGDTLDIQHLLNPDNLAAEISNKFQSWVSLRNGWLEEKKELRNYVFATDTRTTTNSKLDWFNSTTTPKLTGIYDTLKALYSSALFPSQHWLRWEGEDRESNIKDKRDTIQGYMETKLRQSSFETMADRLIDDYILYGNAFATVEWVEEVHETELGETIATFIGPRLVRISPYDIVFDPTAASFQRAPKVTRALVSLGEAQKRVEAGDAKYQAVFDTMMTNRRTVASSSSFDKSDAFIADGFSSIEHYYGSDYIEILTFYGDIYDINEGVLKQNYKIVVADRAYVIEEGPNSNWLGESAIYHAGWRNRPDNLYAMGPLDNLVGMQYRIDHLENLKADVFDQIAFPVMKIKGSVENFNFAPGTQIRLGEDGDVNYMTPDTTALNADFQIRALEDKMEELAGAPRQAIGIRTPGEKTAFEVSTLDNASNRIFQHKAMKMEREFFQPLLTAMLESARRNMDISDTIRVSDEALNVQIFKSITKEDIKGNGKLRPVGASHFAERAQRVQNIVQLSQVKQDPSVAPHLSGKLTAEIIANELGEPALYGENIAVQEQLETQKASQNAEAENLDELTMQAEVGL